MTIDIEKVEQEFDNWFDPNDGQNYWDCWLAAVMFAEAYAAKVLEDKEREIARMDKQIIEMQAYEISMQNRANDDAKEITELKANNDDLREALAASDNLLRELPSIGGFFGLAIMENNQHVLTKTPAQSLQAFENEVIERCAKVAENYMYASIEANKDVSNKIRALKVT